MDEQIDHDTHPAGHPYSWNVIGSMEDLNAASLDDVHEWFKTYYGPSNAVLVIAGDVEAEAVHQKVEKYFGDIPARAARGARTRLDRQDDRHAPRRSCRIASRRRA